MRVQVKKWGNSASIRIPASIMAAAALVIDQEVEMRQQDGCITIEPVTTPAYDLDMLIDRMSPENFPEHVDVSEPIGEEIW